MTIKIKTTLYHAEWCGHCKNFMPEWAKFVENVKNGTVKHPKAKFECDQFEDRELTKENEATVNGAPIRGFPTVKIAVINSEGKTKEFEYDGKRKSDELSTFILIVADRESS